MSEATGPFKGFKNRVALVTGGGSGIGFSTTSRLLAEGATVVVADVDPTAADRAAELGADFLPFDVGDRDAWTSAIEEITTRHGGLDIAFLNAGIMTQPATERGIVRIDVANLPLEDYQRVMSINVDGVVFGIQASLPAISARGGGAIVATSSLAGLLAYPTDAVYAGTKHFVIGMVRSLARILAKQNVTINAICPGGVATNIIGPPETIDTMRERGVDLMDPAAIAEGVVRAITSGLSGEAWMCQAGRSPELHAFGKVPGIGI
jgi:NAD(P)-dependent dehydrogenase (short-subunit alcohol dehydrogenase family)